MYHTCRITLFYFGFATLLNDHQRKGGILVSYWDYIRCKTTVTHTLAGSPRRHRCRLPTPRDDPLMSRPRVPRRTGGRRYRYTQNPPAADCNTVQTIKNTFSYGISSAIIYLWYYRSELLHHTCVVQRSLCLRHRAMFLSWPAVANTSSSGWTAKPHSCLPWPNTTWLNLLCKEPSRILFRVVPT